MPVPMAASARRREAAGERRMTLRLGVTTGPSHGEEAAATELGE